MKRFGIIGVVLLRPSNSHGVAHISTLYGSIRECTVKPSGFGNLIFVNKAFVEIAPNIIVDWRWHNDTSQPAHICYDKNNILALYSDGLFIESTYFTWNGRIHIWRFKRELYYTKQ